MDFRNRIDQSVPGRAVSTPAPTGSSVVSGSKDNKDKEKKNHFKQSPFWVRMMYIALLFSVTVLCISVAYFLSTFNPNESRYAFQGKYQAVFLSNGQVYFGKMHSINGRYADLRNIFYLNSNSTAASSSQSQSSDKGNSFTLVKLGCELHGPYDQMIINHSTITFWENLRDDSQVVKAIKQWQQQNPNGQTCQSNSNSTSQSSSDANAQNAAASATSTGTATGTTTPTSSTSTTKKQ